MKRSVMIWVLVLSLFRLIPAHGQGEAQPISNDPPDAPSPSRGNVADSLKEDVDSRSAASTRNGFSTAHAMSSPFTVKDKFQYFATETFLNPAVLTAPAFSAAIRMAAPPTSGAYTYPDEWRQGAEGFGRNLGDAVAGRTASHTARFLTGVIVKEDPRYFPSESHNLFARSFHALAFTFVDRSDSGRPMPAISNFAGAAAGGAVGMAYLPRGFDTTGYAARRAVIDFGVLAGGNLFREFAPQLPTSVRTFFALIGR